MLSKFKIEQEDDLVDECNKLGLQKLFVPSNDFDPMFNKSIDQMCITKIKQKSYIEIDRNRSFYW